MIVSLVGKGDLPAILKSRGMAVIRGDKRKHEPADLQFVPDFHLFYAVEVDAQHECVIDHFASAPGTEPGLTVHIAPLADLRAAERGDGVFKLTAFCVNRSLGDLGFVPEQFFGRDGVLAAGGGQQSRGHHDELCNCVSHVLCVFCLYNSLLHKTLRPKIIVFRYRSKRSPTWRETPSGCSVR